MFDQTQARYDAASRLPRLAVADGPPVTQPQPVAAE